MTVAQLRGDPQRVIAGGVAALVVLASTTLWPGFASAAAPSRSFSAACTAGGVASATWSGARVDYVYFHYYMLGAYPVGSDAVSLKAARSGAVEAPAPAPADATRVVVGFRVHRGPNVAGLGSIWVYCEAPPP